jgi:hypothetical protein
MSGIPSRQRVYYDEQGKQIATTQAKDDWINLTTGHVTQAKVGREVKGHTGKSIKIKHQDSKRATNAQLTPEQGEVFKRLVPRIVNKEFKNLYNIYNNIYNREFEDYEQQGKNTDLGKFRKLKEFIETVNSALVNDKLTTESRHFIQDRFKEYEKSSKQRERSPTRRELEIRPPAGGFRPQTKTKKPSKFSDTPPSSSMAELMKAQPQTFGIKSGSSSSGSGEGYSGAIKTIEDMTKIMKESTAQSKARSASGSRESSQPREMRGKSEERKVSSGLGTLDISGLSNLPEDSDSEELDEIVEYRDDDPSTVAPLQDQGGAVQTVFDKTISKNSKKIKTIPDAVNIGTDVPQDLRNQRAIDFNQYIGSNPYKIRNEEMERTDERERLANREEFASYMNEFANMSKNPYFEGGGTDVEGEKKGDEQDLMEGGGELKAPASYNVFDTRGLREQLKPKQSPDESIDPIGGTPADNSVRRTAQNSGRNLAGMTPQEERDFARTLGIDLYGDDRLVDRSRANFLANSLNSAGAGGSGIMNEIASYVDLADAGNIGSRYGRNQLNGSDNSSFTTDDPRTLNERFSSMGMRRQGDKINKYVNMNNKGMMYSNLMGRGVSDPSIQSIRDRKDDYIQPDRKHKGNSVNLIRQSNATSIRLNNMYMP